MKEKHEQTYKSYQHAEKIIKNTASSRMKIII